MSKKIRIFVLLLLWFSYSYATHNRAGEITYRQISATTYEVTLITYTYTPSAANETRDELPLDWGDGTISFIPRIKKENLPDNYTKNTYRAMHTFPGPGSYIMIMEDPNRNEGIVNMFESVNIPFSISTTLRIDAILGNNSTPILLNPPIDKAALGQIFIHNPAAYDPDGDSLAYRLTVCTGQNGEPIPNYSFPAASVEFYVNAITGDLVWNAPMQKGAYNVAMVVEEWRMGVKIGEVIRDIQIEVYETDNTTPQFKPLQNICIRAGDTVAFNVEAFDKDNHSIYLSASGGPLELVANKAQFTPAQSVGSVSSQFFWIPGCDEIREQPYTIVFKATDFGGSISLAALQYVTISVIGHPPVSIQADAQTISIALSWKDSLCSNSKSYDIFRSVSPQAFTPEYCETGMPQVLQNAYQFVERISASQSNYIDSNQSLGLSPGFTYCYRMFANYVDSFPSYISEEICVELPAKYPVITNVSVLNTHISQGEMFIAWSMPQSFDSTAFLPPYQYILYRYNSKQDTVKQKVATISTLLDTSFVDNNLNTQHQSYFYSVDLVSMHTGVPVIIGSSPKSSSPFAKAIAQNKQINLSIHADVSWINDTVFVYRLHTNGIDYDSLGIFSNGAFIDSGLENLTEYCYVLKTSGYFNSLTLPSRVYNNSQIICVEPLDTVAPVSVTFTVHQNCTLLERHISWSYSEDEEIQTIQIYYKDCRDTVYSKIASIAPQGLEYTHLLHDTIGNMAGCYYITATDIAGNESSFRQDTCLYNCPRYVLPNIFTPNADGQNELFHPVENKYVQYIDIKLYDSWGQEVYRTSNPEILWNGSHQRSKQVMPDGVFYYVCDVYEYWDTCIVHPRTLVGFVHKFSNEKSKKTKK